MKQPFLSIVIPLYNEEKRIYKSFTQLRQFLKKHKFSTEIVFVDDGSQDNSKLKMKNEKLKIEKAGNTKVKIISYRPNQGKGYALKKGVEKATGRWMLFVDADMSIPLSEFDKFLPKLKDGTGGALKILAGTRDEKSRIAAKQGFLRRFLSQGFRTLSYVLTGVNSDDITCGFKCFEGSIAKKIFGKLQTKRWAYDTEVFMHAKREKIPITPIQITWKEDEETRINMLPSMIGSLKDLVKMRLSAQF